MKFLSPNQISIIVVDTHPQASVKDNLLNIALDFIDSEDKKKVHAGKALTRLVLDAQICNKKKKPDYTPTSAERAENTDMILQFTKDYTWVHENRVRRVLRTAFNAAQDNDVAKAVIKKIWDELGFNEHKLNYRHSSKATAEPT